jgi:hypothetical protein
MARNSTGQNIGHALCPENSRRKLGASRVTAGQDVYDGCLQTVGESLRPEPSAYHAPQVPGSVERLVPTDVPLTCITQAPAPHYARAKPVKQPG